MSGKKRKPTQRPGRRLLKQAVSTRSPEPPRNQGKATHSEDLVAPGALPFGLRIAEAILAERASGLGAFSTEESPVDVVLPQATLNGPPLPEHILFNLLRAPARGLFMVYSYDGYDGHASQIGIFFSEECADRYARSLRNKYSSDDNESIQSRLTIALGRDMPESIGPGLAKIQDYIYHLLGMDLTEAEDLIQEYVLGENGRASGIVLMSGTGETIRADTLELRFSWENGFTFEFESYG
jgi:hypothetical protein